MTGFYRLSLVSALLVLACSKPGDDSAAKRVPSAAPPPGIDLPADMEIPVERDGVIVQTLRVGDLEKHKPDFADADRRAWRLDALLDKKDFPDGSFIEAIGADGVGISIDFPKTETSPLPVLILTRRGGLAAGALYAEDPFPDFHGRGGMLRRPGDSRPRLLTSLVRLRVVSRSLNSAPSLATIENLEIQVGDGSPKKISEKRLAALLASKGNEEVSPDHRQWNLRDIVVETAGRGARLVAVHGDKKVTISEDMWGDRSVQPMLQRNRRGTIKFQWVKGDGNDAGGVIYGVTRLVITP